MLAVSLRELREGPVVRDEEVESPSEVWPDVGIEFVDGVRLRVEAKTVRGGDIHVDGGLEVAVRLTCRRCLADLEERLEIPLDLRFRRHPRDVEGDGEAAPRGEEAVLEGGEVVFPLDPEATEVDLVPALREELLLAVPSFPLCGPECGGLCPKCGVRRDEEDCDCKFEEPDPRWDALRALR